METFSKELSIAPFVDYGIVRIAITSDDLLVIMPPDIEQFFPEKMRERMQEIFDEIGIRVVVLPTFASFAVLSRNDNTNNR